jgi:Uma2 family endonuclease
MSKLHAPDHWTYADYLRLPDDGTRCEILEGERVMTPSPFTPHQAVQCRLGTALVNYVTSQRLGSVFYAPCDVILADDIVVQPDILFVREANLEIVKLRGIFGPPDLAIEILSESHPERDTVRKLGIYGRHGVREYWIVDPDQGRIEIFVLAGGALVRKAVHDRGEARSLTAAPGFTVLLERVFSRT